MSPPETCYFRRSRTRVHRIHVAGRDLHIETPSVSWRQLPALLRLGPPALNRAAVMAHSSTTHDPAARHWHVELLGIEPDLQGHGIGGKLLEEALREAHAVGEPAYLETDTVENVEFYQRRGFKVVAQEDPLGVRTWYMERSGASFQ